MDKKLLNSKGEMKGADPHLGRPASARLKTQNPVRTRLGRAGVRTLARAEALLGNGSGSRGSRIRSGSGQSSIKKKCGVIYKLLRSENKTKKKNKPLQEDLLPGVVRGPVLSLGVSLVDAVPRPPEQTRP